MNKISKEERKLFLRVECQLIKVEGRTELGIYHPAAMIAITHPSKDRQWMLTLLGKIG